MVVWGREMGNNVSNKGRLSSSIGLYLAQILKKCWVMNSFIIEKEARGTLVEVCECVF